MNEFSLGHTYSTLQDQAGAIAELEEKLHEKQQQDAVASSNYEDSVKEIKSQTKLLKEIQKHLGDVSLTLLKCALFSTMRPLGRQYTCLTRRPSIVTSKINTCMCRSY